MPKWNGTYKDFIFLRKTLREKWERNWGESRELSDCSSSLSLCGEEREGMLGGSSSSATQLRASAATPSGAL